MTKLLNPFDILKLYPGKVRLPALPRDESIPPEDYLKVKVHPGTNVSGRVFGVTGLPGTGKTYRLLHDVEAFNSYYGDTGFCQVTSLNNTTVDEVNRRQFTKNQLRSTNVKKHLTLHKIGWNLMGGKELPSEIKVRRKGSPEYNQKPLTKELAKQYVDDADYLNKKRHLKSAYKAWNATEDPFPDELLDTSALPNECGYDNTIYKICLEHQRQFEVGELVLAHPETPFRGALLIDEAQDLSPLHCVMLGWYALKEHLFIRFYGDPNQMMDQDRKMPFLWEQGAPIEEFYGIDKYRRCPLSIAELAEMTMPGLVAPAENWCQRGDLNEPILGQVIPTRTAVNGKGVRNPIPTCTGQSIHESRHRVETGLKYVAPGVVPGVKPEAIERAKEEGLPTVHLSTAFGVKGLEDDVVTVQPMLPKHVKAYLRGDITTRRRVYVALTRCKGRLIIHQEMLDMIIKGAAFKWN